MFGRILTLLTLLLFVVSCGKGNDQEENANGIVATNANGQTSSTPRRSRIEEASYAYYKYMIKHFNLRGLRFSEISVSEALHFLNDFKDIADGTVFDYTWTPQYYHYKFTRKRFFSDYVTLAFHNGVSSYRYLCGADTVSAIVYDDDLTSVGERCVLKNGSGQYMYFLKAEVSEAREFLADKNANKCKCSANEMGEYFVNPDGARGGCVGENSYIDLPEDSHVFIGEEVKLCSSNIKSLTASYVVLGGTKSALGVEIHDSVLDLSNSRELVIDGNVTMKSVHLSGGGIVRTEKANSFRLNIENTLIESISKRHTTWINTHSLRPTSILNSELVGFRSDARFLNDLLGVSFTRVKLEGNFYVKTHARLANRGFYAKPIGTLGLTDIELHEQNDKGIYDED